MNYPVKPVILLVAAWVVWTTLINFYQTPHHWMTTAIVYFMHPGTLERGEVFLAEVGVGSKAGQEWMNALYAIGFQEYYKFSVLLAVLLTVHAIALYLINRYDVNIFGFKRRRYDPP